MYLQSQRQSAAAARKLPTGGNDGRDTAVPPGEVLLLPRGGGGHAGDPKEHFSERAEEYAFLVEACG